MLRLKSTFYMRNVLFSVLPLCPPAYNVLFPLRNRKGADLIMPTGTLIVQTRAARGALPVVGATVTVYCPDANGVLQPCITERTDMSGSTPPIQLETPSLENASPEAVPPFATYRVDIDHPDYRPVTVLDVAMFSDIPTTPPVVMVPPRSVDEQRKKLIINSAELGPTGSGVR